MSDDIGIFEMYIGITVNDGSSESETFLVLQRMRQKKMIGAIQNIYISSDIYSFSELM